MANEILGVSQEINQICEANKTRYAFRTHYVNTKTGDTGIEALIISILSGATFKSNIEATGNRKMAIAQSFYAFEVINEVRAIFGSERYPDETIIQLLSSNMVKTGIVGKIQLSGIEDKPRNCCRPRNKFYLIKPETV